MYTDNSSAKNALNQAVLYIEELKAYHSVGTVNDFQKANELYIGKKPLFVKRSFSEFYICPHCSTSEKYEMIFPTNPYCYRCGCKLLWEEIKRKEK